MNDTKKMSTGNKAEVISAIISDKQDVMKLIVSDS